MVMATKGGPPLGEKMGLMVLFTMFLVLVASVEASNDEIFTTSIEVNATDPSFTVSTDGSSAAEEQEIVVCSLCGDPRYVPVDATARFETGDDSISCQDAHDLGQMELPRENCTFLQDWGTTLCACGPPPSLPIQDDGERCRLCEDGSVLANGFMAGFPQTTCAELQVRANRDDQVACSTYQATIGTYCGCDNPIAVSQPASCRICGKGRPLPDHLQVIERHQRKTCGELEFDASIPGEDCRLFQKLYGDQCCHDNPQAPIRSAATATEPFGFFFSLAAGTIAMAIIGSNMH